MKIRYLKSILFAVVTVGAITLAIANAEQLLELGFDAILFETRVETKKSIDKFSIGFSKREVVARLKEKGVSSVVILDEEYFRESHIKRIPIKTIQNDHLIYDYDHWYFSYNHQTPHGEFYDLYFKNNNLIKIIYRRKRFQWDL